MKKRGKPSGKRVRPERAAPIALPRNLKVVFTPEQIQKRVLELADQINRNYQAKTLYVVGILEDCFVFMADLIRALKVPVICDFVKAEINDSPPDGIATREIKYTPRIKATGKDVLLVDGILQSGLTLDHLVGYMLGQNPASVRTASLVEKVDERKVDVPTDYVGFQASGKFLVGYGLGHEGRYRNLPCIAAGLASPGLSPHQVAAQGI